MDGDQQSTSHVLMVRPTHFAFNSSAAADNRFMHADYASRSVAAAASGEFRNLVTALEGVGVVVTVRDGLSSCPDAVFPNNWFSVHRNEMGRVAVFFYPMKTANRQLERTNTAVIAYLKEYIEEGRKEKTQKATEEKLLAGREKLKEEKMMPEKGRKEGIYHEYGEEKEETKEEFEAREEKEEEEKEKIRAEERQAKKEEEEKEEKEQEKEREAGVRSGGHSDLIEAEEHGKALEGTGSLVLDRISRIAYCCVSERTDEELAERWRQLSGYEKIVSFTAHDKEGAVIYHTNVMLAIGTHFAVICLASITDEGERKEVRESLEASGRYIVDITFDQVLSFCGNVLEVRMGDGTGLALVLSERAKAAFSRDQLDDLANYGHIDRFVAADFSTIEECGGGGVRCAIAELF